MPYQHEIQRAVDEKLLVERMMAIRADSLKENDDRTVDVIISTEYEYRNWFGREVLSHDKGAIDTSRMDSKTAPVLLDHNRSQVIGVVENVRLQGKEMHGTLKFSRNSLASEVYTDILDGIRSQISTGYIIRKYEVDETDINDPLFTIREWEPYEASVVAINADPNALVKREGYFYPANAERKKPMTEERTEEEGTDDTPQSNDSGVYVAGFAIYARGQEEKEPTLANEIMSKRGTVDDFEAALKAKRDLLKAQQNAAADESESPDDANRFNISDLVFQVLNEGAERGKQALVEAKDLTADAERRGAVRQGGGFILPHTRLDNGATEQAQRDLTTAAASGGHLVGDDVRGDAFIYALRNAMVTGDWITMLMGLRGNASIPKETTAPTAAWLGEVTQATESDPVIGQIEFSPKFVRGYTEISRTLIAQSTPDVEMIVRNSLMKGVGLVVDKAIFSGTGANNQPSGIDNISSVSETTYATALSNATIENLTTVEQALDDANVSMMSRGWIVNPNVRSHYRQKPIATGGIPAWYNMRLLDERARVTSQVAAGTAYYAEWMNCYLGCWDDIEVLINPFSKDREGLIRIVAWQLCDIRFAHNEAFAILKQA